MSCILDGTIERVLTVSVKNKVITKTVISIPKEEFVNEIWKWKEESGGQIINQLKRLGSSCDWERERFTLDEGLSKAVLYVFNKLYVVKPNIITNTDKM